MSDPSGFGWTQGLTLLGYAITIVIAVCGFQSFGRWQRQKFEEKRIDTAVDALVLIREMTWVFDNIRSPMSFEYEWKDMPNNPSDNEDMRRNRGSFYAVLKRIEGHREFFDRAYKLQVRCGALFGQEAEDALVLLQRARREVEVSAGMLMRDPWPENRTEVTKRTWEKFRTDVWAGNGEAMGVRDTVLEKLEECRRAVEAICRPAVDRQFGKEKRSRAGRVLSWFGM